MTVFTVVLLWPVGIGNAIKKNRVCTSGMVDLVVYSAKWTGEESILPNLVWAQYVSICRLNLFWTFGLSQLIGL